MTQDEVLDALEDSRETFLDAIDGLNDEAMLQPGVVGDWSIKDILSHLIAWEAELIKLLWQAQQGEKPTTAHFTNLKVDDLNASWHTLTQDRPLERVMADFQSVRKQTVRRVEGFEPEDFDNPTRYHWLMGQTLSDWIKSDSFGHEKEHAEQVMRWREAKGL